MANPFEYVNTITHSKKNMMRDSENDALAEKGYSPFMANKALSYFEDTILHANLMNVNYHLDNRPQYEFLINSIRPRKRFSKWHKEAENEDLELICNVYECSKQKGREYLSLLSREQIEIMKQEQKQGGILNERDRKLGRG